MRQEANLRVLIIDDSAEVTEAISVCLQLRWPEATIVVAVEGTRGLRVLETESFDMVLLDINLPDIDGFEILKRIRSFSNVPTVILTVRGREEDQNKGLDMGADDYIVKPFSPRDLVARVNAVLRRTKIPTVAPAQPCIVRGNLSFNFANGEVRLRDRTTKLTPTESKLLYVFMKNNEGTLSSEQILREVWGKEHSNTEPLRTYIRRLRDKLNDNPPQIILSEYGEGYKFVSPS